MSNETAGFLGRVIEERMLCQLARHSVLSFEELRRYAAPGGDCAIVRQVLAGLIERGAVVRKPHRRGLWYQGYARASVREQPGDDEMPVVFVRLLEELELRHADW